MKLRHGPAWSAVWWVVAPARLVPQVLGIVVVAAGIGNSFGTVLGNLLKNFRPQIIALVVLCVDLAMATSTALLYGIATVIPLGLCAGLSSQLAKLSYDALVQAEVPEGVRTSVSPGPKRCSRSPGSSAARSASCCH